MKKEMFDPGMEQFTTEQSVSTLFWLGDRIPGGFFIYRNDDTQEIIYANRETLRIFGCETEEQFQELTGNTFRGIVHPNDYPAVQASIQHQIENNPVWQMDFVEYRIVRRDGQVRWVDDYGHFAHLPGYGDVFYVFISDITEKRHAQNEKVQIEMELFREKHLSEMKSMFLFNMSHDIRTPMNAILGFSTLAKRHIREPEILSDYLDKIVSSGRQMLALLDDMLEMNRLESGKIKLGLERTNLKQQIDMVIDLFRLEAEEKRLSLIEEVDLSGEEVLLDQSRFRRIITNLLSNAVKFTPPGGTVTVSAKRKQVSESGFVRYQFKVADTGVGISKEFMCRMYQSFERESTSTQTGSVGTGLGLSIVKSLLNLMGGTITAESEKGKGSVFTVELPLKLADDCQLPADPPPEPADARAAGEYRILIVEDIEINRTLAQTLLEDAGFLVETVPDGCDAVEAVRNHPAWYYDLVLMDIQMPVMNGYEAARAIRAIPREDAALLPIIALSANFREEDKRMSLESGMNCHVAKPFDIDPLVVTINEYIAARRG